MADTDLNVEELKESTSVPYIHQVVDDLDVDLAIVQVEPMVSAAGTTATLNVDTAVARYSPEIFQSRMQQLQAYREEHGHCNVPIDYSLQPG